MQILMIKVIFKKVIIERRINTKVKHCIFHSILPHESRTTSSAVDSMKNNNFFKLYQFL